MRYASLERQPRTAPGPPFSPRFHRLMKKIHAYVGLINFSILLVFGAVGLIAMVERGGEQSPPRIEWQRDISYAAPENAGDTQVADDVYRFLRPPLASPPGRYAVRRDKNQNLVISFYTANGPIEATVLERERRLHVERRRNGMGDFLSNIHSSTPLDASGTLDWRLRLWAWYMELSIWSLLAMAISGVLLWVSSRPRYRPAWFAFGGGAAIFAALYILVR